MATKRKANTKSLVKALSTQPVLIDMNWEEDIKADYSDSEQEGAEDNQPQTVDDVCLYWGAVGIVYISGVLVNGWQPEEDCKYTDLCIVTQALNMLRGDETITSIWLVVDSPGGFIKGCKALSDLIFNIDKVKQVNCWIWGNSYSAAYWISSQCRYIFTDIDGQAGSIGNYLITTDQTKSYSQQGIELNIFSEGKGKLAGNSLYTMTEEDKAHFQSRIKKSYDQFVSDVARKREVNFEEAGAYTWDADDSTRLGLIDGVYTNLMEAITSNDGYSTLR